MNKSQAEARALINEGHGEEELVHFSYEDCDQDGISSPLTIEEFARGGYISTYYTLAEVASDEFWA